MRAPEPSQMVAGGRVPGSSRLAGGNGDRAGDGSQGGSPCRRLHVGTVLLIPYYDTIRRLTAVVNQYVGKNSCFAFSNRNIFYY